MGTVVDLTIFKKSGDIKLSILSTPEEDLLPKALKPVTLRLNLLARKAKRIIYYTPETGVWKTTSATKVCIVIKDIFYTLTQPLPGMLRLIVFDGSAMHVDMYFSKKFNASPEYMTMLLALIDEVWVRGGYVDIGFLSRINHADIEKIRQARARIDWDALHKNPFGDDPSSST